MIASFSILTHRKRQFSPPKRLAGQVPGLRFWRPLNVGGDVRQYGVCMEMDNAEARKNYGNDPYHKIWTDAYSKVRVEGTTTFDILGQ